MKSVTYPTLRITQQKTYLFSAMFIVGNILLPQLCHLLPQGGLMLLPIYFFTLVGAYCYGIHVGLLTAILSPLVNSMLFGMPPAPALPAILVKSISLAVAASVVARRAQRVSIPLVALAVLACQTVGVLQACIQSQGLAAALHDVYFCLPGLLIQVFLGYWVIRKISK